MFGALYFALPWYDKIPWIKMSAAIFAGILSFTLSQYLRLENSSEKILFGMILVVVSIALDAIVTTGFIPHLFSNWQTWLGYALVLFVPIARESNRNKSFA